jgi:hypothetical protein
MYKAVCRKHLLWLSFLKFSIGIKF